MRTIPLLALLLSVLPAACRAPGPRDPGADAVIGRLAPEVPFRWLEGGDAGSLRDLRGRVVLLEFWRTWCGPCLQQVGHLNDLHEIYRDDGLVVVALTSEQEDVVRGTVAEAGLAYPVGLIGDDAVERAYGITAVPRAFLIDREGELVWVGHPGTLEEGRLRELIFER